MALYGEWEKKSQEITHTVGFQSYSITEMTTLQKWRIGCQAQEWQEELNWLQQ